MAEPRRLRLVKAGLVGLTKVMGKELAGSGVLVICYNTHTNRNGVDEAIDACESPRVSWRPVGLSQTDMAA